MSARSARLTLADDVVVVAADSVQAGVLASVVLERSRQDAKWGADSPSRQDLALRHLILSEEVGEAAEAALENDRPSLRAELVQVAAVAITTVEALDRGWMVSPEAPPCRRCGGETAYHSTAISGWLWFRCFACGDDRNYSLTAVKS